VVRVPKYYDERIRDEFDDWGYEAEIHEPKPFKSQLAFMQFLKTQHIEPKRTASPFTFTTFIEVANDMAKSMKDTRKHFLSLFYFYLSTWIYRLCKGATVGVPRHGEQSSVWPRKWFSMQARHNRRFRYTLEERQAIVAMPPICGRKSV
jgi:hypothetical protein